jgi:hypothetical protein
MAAVPLDNPQSKETQDTKAQSICYAMSRKSTQATSLHAPLISLEDLKMQYGNKDELHR